MTADDNLWAMIDAQTRHPWELSYNGTTSTAAQRPLPSSSSSCGASKASTHGCCPERGDSKDGSACRASFRCPVDPCASKATNDCASTARCERTPSPRQIPNYTCQCPDGLMGNGRKCRPGIDLKPSPKVMFDGVTPTEDTIKNNYYCDCTEPIIDACSGFPPCKGKHEVCTVTEDNVPVCACKPGFVHHDVYGCVDTSPPTLRLKHDPNDDQTLRLKQGDIYKEHAVEIQDENAEEYLRSLKIAYSQPLPQGCLTRTGSFHVNYTVATPWTSPPYVRITRNVVIEDIDECDPDVARKLQHTCPQLVPKCDAESGATCVNTIGSYTCQCPKFTMGDGFLSGLSFDSSVGEPEGYGGGTGCRDTSKPVIHLNGPNPKVFRLCGCGGISGIMGNKQQQSDGIHDLRDRQQRRYGQDIKELIAATAGAELCATHANSKPKPIDCVSAYDDTYQGRVPLSREVTIGEPIQKSPLHWQVPYNVKDEAGNSADTVYRDVVVEEVDIDSLESTLRKEMEKDSKTMIDTAVSRALEEDRKKRGSRHPHAHSAPASCPKCPKCDCHGEFDLSECESICKSRKATCTVDENSTVVQLLLWLESLFPPALAPSILLVVIVIFFFLCLRGLVSLVFAPASYGRNDYAYDDERNLKNTVTYYNDNGTQTKNPPVATAPGPTPSGSTETLFSPRPYPGQSQQKQNGASYTEQQTVQITEESIYATPTHSGLITPSNREPGLRRRSPFSPTF